MVKRCLIVDLRPSAVSLAVASHDADSHLITDCAGRVVHALDAPQLWGDAHAPLTARTRQLTTLFEHRDGSFEDPAAVGAAVTLLLSVIKTFAESRLERQLQDIAVTLPQSLSIAAADLVRVCADRAGFHGYRRMYASSAAMLAYGLEKCERHEVYSVVVNVTSTRVEAAIVSSEDEILEHVRTSDCLHDDGETIREYVHRAIETVLHESQLMPDCIDHLLFMGEIPSDMADAVAHDLLIECLPVAQLHNTFSPDHVSVYGMMQFMQRFMAPAPPTEIIGCLSPVIFTIGVEGTGGVSEPLLPRNTILPTTRRSRVQNFCAQGDQSVELRFCEGERAFYEDNIPLGTIRLNGLRAGWNDLQVCVDMTCDYMVQIDVTVIPAEATTNRDAGTLHQTLTVASAVNTMRGDGVMAYFDELELVPTRAEEATRRQRVDARLCTNALVAAASEALGRAVPIGITGDLRMERLQFTDSRASESEDRVEAAPPVDLLNLLNCGAEQDDAREETLHNAALTFVGDHIQWLGRFQFHRCTHCVKWNSVL